MPPWVRHQFPVTGRLVRRLRDTPCHDSRCDWCRERHDSGKELKRWLGFDEFRQEPTDGDGRSLQQSVVEAVMRGESALAILPTGTGKSVLLSGVGAVPLRQDGGAYRSHLAAGGPHG